MGRQGLTVHITAQAVCIRGIVRQRCAWCGELLFEANWEDMHGRPHDPLALAWPAENYLQIGPEPGRKTPVREAHAGLCAGGPAPRLFLVEPEGENKKPGVLFKAASVGSSVDAIADALMGPDAPELNPKSCPRCGRQAYFRYLNLDAARQRSALCWDESSCRDVAQEGGAS